MAYCAYCKARILDPHQKCPNCGSTAFRTDDEPVVREKPQVEYQTVYVEKPVYQTVYVEKPVAVMTSARSWLVTVLLCIFFGYAGFHRFYAGKIGTGLLFLMTGGFFGIGWLIDIIRVLTGSFVDNYGLPINR